MAGGGVYGGRTLAQKKFEQVRQEEYRALGRVPGMLKGEPVPQSVMYSKVYIERLMTPTDVDGEPFEKDSFRESADVRQRIYSVLACGVGLAIASRAANCSFQLVQGFLDRADALLDAAKKGNRTITDEDKETVLKWADRIRSSMEEGVSYLEGAYNLTAIGVISGPDLKALRETLAAQKPSVWGRGMDALTPSQRKKIAAARVQKEEAQARKAGGLGSDEDEAEKDIARRAAEAAHAEN